MGDDKDRQVLCQVRREWVAATPEEVVRQRLLYRMIHDLGYPSALIAVEKAIRQLPHLAGVNPKGIPDRRVDIICYRAGVQDAVFAPLIVIECKAVALTWRVISQVLGYNQIIQSPFVTIANETDVRTAWFDREEKNWVFVESLPAYQELVSRL